MNKNEILGFLVQALTKDAAKCDSCGIAVSSGSGEPGVRVYEKLSTGGKNMVETAGLAQKNAMDNKHKGILEMSLAVFQVCVGEV